MSFLVVDPRIRIPLRELRIHFVRSSGPGGQKVDKTSTKAVLRFDVGRSPSITAAHRKRILRRFPRRISAEGVIVLRSQRFRDQGRNLADVLEKLRAMLVETARPPRKRIPTQPTKASVRKRGEEKRRRSRKKTLRRDPSLED